MNHPEGPRSTSLGPWGDAALALADGVPVPVESVLAATERSISALGALDEKDAGAARVLVQLAEDIDAIAAGHKKPDNVAVPTYLKYCEALGLTPAARSRMDVKPQREAGKLGQLRAVAAGA